MVMQDATENFTLVHPLEIIKTYLPAKFNLGKVDLKTLDYPKPKRIEKSRPPIHSILNLHDMEAVAKNVMSKEAWAYYSSAADDEITFRENHLAFHRILFKPRVLVYINLECFTYFILEKCQAYQFNS